MPTQEHRTQIIALICIFFGTGAGFLASHYGYRDMIITAVGIVGVGSGMITGQQKQQVNNTKTGAINAPTDVLQETPE